MNPPANARLISYLRVSAMGARSEDNESFQSFKQQRKAIKSICNLAHATVIEEVEVPNASGGKSWPEPKLREAIDRVDRGEADGVVVYALDRWGRSLQALEVIERWAKEGKVFLSASEKFDATTPAGRLQLTFMMGIARYYWESTRDRFADSQDAAIKRGVHIGRVPLGYRPTVIGHDLKGKPVNGPLEPDPATASIVRDTFEAAASAGMHAAMDVLRERVPDRRWRTDETRRLLRSRAYLGESRLGELVNEHAHEPLVDLNTWTAAQTEPHARRTNGEYVLSGIATCACGAALVGALQSVRGRRYRRYRCSSPTCRGGSSIRAETLEEHVRAEVQEGIDHGVLQMRHVGTDTDALRAAMLADKAEKRRWAEDTDMREIIGDEDHRAGARARAERAAQSLAAYEAATVTEARTEDVPPRVDTDEDLLAAIRALGITIAVRPGRGAVAERVTLTERLGQDDVDN